MKQHVSFRGINDAMREQLRLRVSEELGRLDQVLADHSPEIHLLEVHFEQDNASSRYHVKLRLRLGTDVLLAAEEGFDLSAALPVAFEELERGAVKWVERRRENHALGPRDQRRQLRELLRASSSDLGRSQTRLLREVIEQCLDRLHGFIRREIGYLEGTGAVEPGDLDAVAILDGVVLRALERAEDRPPELSLEHWLLKLAVDVAEEEVTALGRPPEEAQADADAADADAWDWPEDARVEERLAASDDSSPEDTRAWFEMQRSLQRALAALPRSWRQLTILCALEGLDAADAARAFGFDAEDAREMLGHAEAFLRDRVHEEGWSGEDLEVALEETLEPTTAVPAPQPLRRELESLLQASETA